MEIFVIYYESKILVDGDFYNWMNLKRILR